MELLPHLIATCDRARLAQVPDTRYPKPESRDCEPQSLFPTRKHYARFHASAPANTSNRYPKPDTRNPDPGTVFPNLQFPILKFHTLRSLSG